jgi:hypothetical protein
MNIQEYDEMSSQDKRLVKLSAILMVAGSVSFWLITIAGTIGWIVWAMTR